MAPEPEQAAGYLNNGQLLAGNMEYVVASNNVSMGGGTLNLAFRSGQ